MTYTVRNAKMDDLGRIEAIYARARQFMADNGNPNQWGKTNPPHDQLVQDIADQRLFVLEDGTGIHGVFYFYIGADPTYAVIYDGAWRSNMPYGTIHRIAGDGSGGVLKAAVAFGAGQISHLRIDTHEDNRIMQQAIAKQGFSRRGIIHLKNGSPRIAYDKVME